MSLLDEPLYDLPPHPLVHGEFLPMDIHPEHHIRTDLRHATGESIEAELIRISPLGADFRIMDGSLPVTAKSELEATFQFVNQRFTLPADVIYVHYFAEAGAFYAGLSFRSESWNDSSRIWLDRSMRNYLCSERFPALVTAQNLIEFSEKILFRIDNISHSGAKLVTSRRTASLLPGMRLEGLFEFPMVGRTNCAFVIRWIRQSVRLPHDYELGVQFTGETKILNRLSAEYVLQFGEDTTIRELKESSLIVKKSRNAIAVRYIRSRGEYEEVLALRRKAYQGYQKDDSSAIAELEDKFDKRSRIVVAKHHGKTIGTCRLTFHEKGELLEQEEHVAWTKDRPDNSDLVEATRYCVDPEYRSSDVILELIKFSVAVMVKTQRRYLVGSTPPHLKSFYQRIGGQTLPYSYSPESVPDLKLQVLLFDGNKMLKGGGISPQTWGMFYSAGIIEEAVKSGYLKMNPLDWVRYAGLRLFYEIFKKQFQ
jgi:predicted GNAT family N-acyltransferase